MNPQFKKGVLGLIVLEVFLPGFGLPGLSGIALVGVGTALAAYHFGMLTAVGILLVIIAILAFLILHEYIPVHMILGIVFILCGSLTNILPGLLHKPSARSH